jgi:hypothetical protein
LSERNLKPELVRFGGRLLTLAVLMLAVTVGLALVLLLRVATGSGGIAWGGVAAGVMAWSVVCWVIVPQTVRRRGLGASVDREPEDTESR